MSVSCTIPRTASRGTLPPDIHFVPDLLITGCTMGSGVLRLLTSLAICLTAAVPIGTVMDLFPTLLNADFLPDCLIHSFRSFPLFASQCASPMREVPPAAKRADTVSGPPMDDIGFVVWDYLNVFLMGMYT